jgi:hypothetical protein
MNIFSGIIIAELSMVPAIIEFASSRSFLNCTIPFFLVITGLFFFSFPGFKPEWQPWTNALRDIGIMISPNGSNNNDVQSLWSSIGAIIILFGITLSDILQSLLSNPVLLYLGTHSFPIYLIHGPLLRSFLNWILYAFTPTLERYPIPPGWKFVIALPIYFSLLIGLASLWTAKIEPRCGAITKWLEDTMCRHEVDTPLLLTQVPPKEYEAESGSSRSASPISEEEGLLPQ